MYFPSTFLEYISWTCEREITLARDERTAKLFSVLARRAQCTLQRSTPSMGMLKGMAELHKQVRNAHRAPTPPENSDRIFRMKMDGFAGTGS